MFLRYHSSSIYFWRSQFSISSVSCRRRRRTSINASMDAAILQACGLASSWLGSATTSTGESSFPPSSPSPPHASSASSPSPVNPNSNPNPNPNPDSNPDPSPKRRRLLSEPHKPVLTSQQQRVISAVAAGHSVFITGSAGTGKTFLLGEVIRLLREIHPPSTVFVTASTGVAACALGGQTLHSFAGIGLGKGDLAVLLTKVARSKPAYKRWTSVQALVIDEVSMIDGELFDRLELIAKKMRPRAAGLPWGGIQLIVSGDFFQLPPINAPNPMKEFAFEAECWAGSFHLQVELTRIFRQSDSTLIDLLQGIRRGLKNDNLFHVLESCRCAPSSQSDDDTGSITRLFPRNEDVRRLNNERLKSLGGDILSYKAIDTGRDPWKAQLKQGIALDELEICVGARVMLIKNTDVGVGLVNGATGTVTGFVDDHDGKVRDVCSGGGVLPRVRFDCGPELAVKPEKWDVMEGEKVRATRWQVPLILAWALSVHKCQGMTLNQLQTDLSRAFGCGMVYVALSRVRSLAGLRLSGFNPKKIKAHPKVLNFYDKLLTSKP